MSSPLTIRCECGHVVHGEDEARLLSAAREHLSSRHPELVGRLTDADLLAMSDAPRPHRR